MESIRVVIVGAGIGGLALGQALHKAGIDFQIFERDAAPTARSQGYRIKINADGQKAIQACLPSELHNLFRITCAQPLKGAQTFDAQLRTIGNRWVDTWSASASDTKYDENVDDLSVNRLTMREIFMCGIEDRIHFDAAFVSFEELGENVISRFSNGVSMGSELLVACDGTQSNVVTRRFPDHEISDTGTLCCFGKMFMDSGGAGSIPEELLKGTSIIFDGGLVAVIDTMFFSGNAKGLTSSDARCGITPLRDYMYWALTGRSERFGLSGVSDAKLTANEIHQVAQKMTSKWSSEVQHLFRYSDSSALALFSIKSASEIQTSHPTRVTALGDAIHVMSPAGGLGANTTLRDAANLAGQLKNCFATEGSILKAVERYEQDMRSYGREAIASSFAAARQLFGSNSSEQI